jgi:hypothetical protein
MITSDRRERHARKYSERRETASLARVSGATPGKNTSNWRHPDLASLIRATCCLVMPAPVAGIHVLSLRNDKDVDGRDKPGHDRGKVIADATDAWRDNRLAMERFMRPPGHSLDGRSEAGPDIRRSGPDRQFVRSISRPVESSSSEAKAFCLHGWMLRLFFAHRARSMPTLAMRARRAMRS